MVGPLSYGPVMMGVVPGDFPPDEPIRELVDRWCERRDLAALRLILSAWPRVSGLTDEWAQVLEALRSLRASRHLPGDEQEMVKHLVIEVEAVVYRPRGWTTWKRSSFGPRSIRRTTACWETATRQARAHTGLPTTEIRRT